MCKQGRNIAPQQIGQIPCLHVHADREHILWKAAKELRERLPVVWTSFSLEERIIGGSKNAIACQIGAKDLVFPDRFAVRPMADGNDQCRMLSSAAARHVYVDWNAISMTKYEQDVLHRITVQAEGTRGQRPRVAQCT